MLGYRDICAFLVILLLSELWSDTCAEGSFNDLPLCRNYQACGSRLRNYPIVEESIGEIIEEIGSGHGSGNEHNTVPIYDEFVSEQPPFDFLADPEIVQKRLCRCEDENEDDSKCPFDEPENLMQIDSTLSLSFCHPVQNTIRSKCLGRRQLVRVMGKIHETGQSLVDVDDTAVFCNCETFHRYRIEPWLSGYVFSYRCAK
ncbi:hypothetical protein M3Y97_00385000 [Aphelenchoides bicaudatus]|nr:hypothetical protein M3Y97_00385000 [Aphelenchoides bicaudatus]